MRPLSSPQVLERRRGWTCHRCVGGMPPTFRHRWPHESRCFGSRRVLGARFVFDSGLVVLTVLDAWIIPLIYVCSGGFGGGLPGQMDVLRIARVLRVSRVARTPTPRPGEAIAEVGVVRFLGGA